MMTQLPIPAPCGFDFMIAARDPTWSSFLPVGIEVTLLGRRVAFTNSDLDPEQLIRTSLTLHALIAQVVKLGGIPDRVASAWFTVTTDPTVVKKYGEAHDCATCRAGTDRALAVLREHPNEPLVVGILAFG